MLSYSRKGGSQGFGPDGDATMVDMIRWVGAHVAAGLVDYVKRRNGRAHVVRYEDLVTRQEATLREIVEFIGADAPPETVAAMVTALAHEGDGAQHHATTASAKQSIGRWRGELDPAQRELAEHLLRSQLDALGYE